MENKKEEYALNNKCPSCGASINFNPKTEKWDCLYCKSSFTLEELKKYDNASNDKNNNDEVIENNNVNYVTYKCKSCGAEVIADEQTAATFCVYCRNTTILKSKLSGEFKPDLIIPFKKEKKSAIEAFQLISKGRPLTPKYFNSESNIEKIRGVYIPFWLYDLNVSGNLNFNATKIDHWTVGRTHYTKTSNYKIIRDGIFKYDKIPSDASTRFDDALMDSIEPFNYSELKEYNHAYLAGFLAEKYDINSENLYPNIEKMTLKTTENYSLTDLESKGQNQGISRACFSLQSQGENL